MKTYLTLSGLFALGLVGLVTSLVMSGDLHPFIGRASIAIIAVGYLCAGFIVEGRAK